MTTPKRPKLLTISPRETSRINQLLRAEFTSGLFVILAAALGFFAANSALSEQYFALRDFTIGPESLHLNLSIGTWAADGLLAVFFFIVGLELKREFAFGALSKLSNAIVPVAAAAGGVIVPALIYSAFTFGTPEARGWAIPTATDIAFAVAVLGLIAPRIPPALRVFLLTLAVVDDLIAIAIIAVFYTDELHFFSLALSLGVIVVFGVVAQFASHVLIRAKWAAWLVLLPIGVVAWALMHASGVHATIAGVLLAFTVPVATRASRRAKQADGSEQQEGYDLAGSFAERFALLSSLVAVPIFAFFAAGVSISGDSRFPFDPIAYGILVGLVIGKPVGIATTTWLITKFTQAELGEAVSWRQIIGVAALGGIGFTVSLLVTDLSFTNAADADTARLAVMVGSLIAAALASLFLARRNRTPVSSES